MMRVTAQRLPEHPIITPAQVTPLHPVWDIACARTEGVHVTVEQEAARVVSEPREAFGTVADIVASLEPTQ